MKKLKYWIRWITVFPGALLAGFLITLPLHLVLYLAFNNDENFLGFIELPPGSNTSIEYAVYPFVVALTYVFVGYKLAPKNKFKTAVTLFLIYFIVWSIITTLSLLQGNIYGVESQFTWRTLLSLIGAVTGLYAAKKDSKIKKHLCNQ
jgi:uncharacterized BrkB/YihY/UPF0761 family membrane protein